MATIHDFKPHAGQPSVPATFSPSITHKLYRATAITRWISVDACLAEGNMLPAVCLPHIISYLREDLAAISQEARALGLIPNSQNND
ncbi:hypothetical protein [Edwardsiella tarda]|uniref:Uncharacterized protein n=1 Tax=Edwardsiella tarda ATCC 15947 = NBRC 105688 TaxID=667121 RepID=A0AC61TMI7_EDWTA|nr:hypothetical protein [Edwardsiella tarda]UCQ01929.1 hypothetical protein DCL27_00270 [Edwardsiella tarda ATCC 15947 = NBRC 105688]